MKEHKVISILHILSDDKFVDPHIERFQGSIYKNEFVYLSENLTYKGKYLNSIKIVKPGEIDKLVEKANQVDILIIYFLDYYKASLVNKIKDNPVIIWHFYGAEIYHTLYHFKKNIYSKKTLISLRKKSPYLYLKGAIRKNLMQLKSLLSPGRELNKEIRHAIKKINYLIWYSKDEYDLINNYFDNRFPQFLHLPLQRRITETFPQHKQEKNTILLGNSFSPSNNHIDILEFLNEIKFPGRIILPFSYGYDSNYKHNVKQQATYLNLTVEFLEDFIPFKEYFLKISRCEAAVFNSYRQMALGNIFLSLTNGIKVYLSEKNPNYYWLKNCGFNIYSIELNLKKDINTDNLRLDDIKKLENIAAYNRLTDPKLNELFIQELCNLI